VKSQSTGTSGSRRARLLQYVIPAAFLAWCVLSFRHDVTQVSLLPLLRSWDLVVAAAALSLLNYLLRALRWRYYLGWLGHRVGVTFGALSFAAGFAYTLSPGKLGELARARYYLPRGVPLADTAAAFFAERLLDIAVVVVLAALWSISSARYLPITIGVAAAVGTLLVLMTALPWPRVVIRVRSWRRVPSRARESIAGALSAITLTRPLFKLTALAAGFAIGLLAWGLEAVGLWLLAEMFPAVHLDLLSAAGIYGLGLLAGGISMVPGGLGSTEAVIAALLATRGFSVPEALLITMACRLVTLWLAVLIGWTAVVALRRTTPYPVTP
jgi:uncharacterized protein (TIRG00374 family)